MATSRRVVGNNFDPYLVGLQWTSEGGTPLFTIGNFQITTNLTPPPKRNFQLGEFSDPLTLENLGTTLVEAIELVNNNFGIFLNLNTENLLTFTLFGSFREFIRVELEQIILNWPGSIYVFYNYGSVFGNTVTNYVYDSATNTATFDVSTNFFYNNFNINFLQIGNTFSGTSIPSSIRNLTVYYSSYEIYVNGQSYPIINFVPSSTVTNGTVSFTVVGDPFNGAATSIVAYHIRPISSYIERFFSTLSDFGRFLLNRNTVPAYTANIYYEEQNEIYQTAQRVQRLTWPTSDGYNLDINTAEFLIYRQRLLDIASNYDDYRTDLMRRVLVTESVSYFELNPRLSQYYPINSTDKIEKLLNVYGREFDEVRKYIEGISFAATVSYNKQGNTPDALIKDFAYYLGWDLLSPMDENQLLANFIPTQTVYSGMTVGYTPAEAEAEFWRRIILNSAFLWKSKGTRKAIEFFFDFINAPPALINFNEYIYQAKRKLDVATFRSILSFIFNDDDISAFNVDENGYPKVPIDTLRLYFQKGGGWYRETAGENSQIDYYEGNNPHIGPYDAGKYYIDSFRCLLNAVIDENTSANSLSGGTLTITDEYVQFTNIFTNYFGGNVDGYNGDVFVDPVDGDNDPTDCILISGTVVNNPSTQPEYNVCGCLIPSAITQAILITVVKNPNPNPGCTTTVTNPCPDYLTYYDLVNGYHLWVDTSDPNVSTLTSIVSEECCTSIGGTYDFASKKCLGGIPATGTTTPCPTNLTYIGISSGYHYWNQTINGVISVTNIVSERCCQSVGGIFDQITQTCLAPSTTNCSDYCVTNITRAQGHSTTIRVFYYDCNGQTYSPTVSQNNNIVLLNVDTTRPIIYNWGDNYIPAPALGVDYNIGAAPCSATTTNFRRWTITTCTSGCDQNTATCGCVGATYTYYVYTDSSVTVLTDPSTVIYNDSTLTPGDYFGGLFAKAAYLYSVDPTTGQPTIECQLGSPC